MWANRLAHINLARGFRGGERQTELLIRGLAGEGWQQTLVARCGQPLVERCAGIPGLQVTAVSNNIIAALRALGGADLVHAHDGRSLQAALLNRWLRGVPYVVTRRVQKGPVHSYLNRLKYRQAAAIVTLSNAISRSVQALLPESSCIGIPSACSGEAADEQRVVAIRRSIGSDFIVGHVGALDDSAKGQLQIIAVARSMLEQAPEVAFVMVGSGKDEELFKREAAGLPNVYFPGQVDNVADYLEAFDVFLFPSRHEGLGSILLDALAHALPIVATAAGGIPDIVEDGINGYLCAVDDIDALGTAVLALYRDAELAGRIARVNRDKAQQYSPAKMTRRYIEVYRGIMEPAPDRG